MWQWILVVVVSLAVIGFVLYLGRDVRSTIGFIGATIAAVVDADALPRT